MNKYQEATLVQAIQYARRGWHVLPCNWKKHPLTPNGFYDATTDEEQIIRWWQENPKSLIGIRTGKESGFWAVDIDMKGAKNGLESLQKHFGESLTLDDGLFQKTPTGGLHLCFKYDDDNPVGCGVNYLDGVDVRGDGGFIIAAPSSININNEWIQYRWKDIDSEPSVAPQWAYDLLELRTSSTRNIDMNAILQSGITEGSRDTSIFRIACMLEREGVDIDTARVFIELLAACCKPPFSSSDAVEKVNRAYTEYATEKGIQLRIDALKKQRDGELRE